jgi:hypothetical protein
MSGAPRLVLYHYTTQDALQSILSSQELRPSLARSRPRDVRYGEGQYLTDIPPGSMTGAQLSRLLLGHPFEARRFSHFLAIDVTGLTVVRGRAGIFVIPGNLNLHLADRIVTTGRNADDLHEGSVDAQFRA